jgi:pimeloyl-ACP methyl ester carboxylesterase
VEDLTPFEFEFDLDIRPTLRSLAIPTLLLYGDSDRWVPIEESIEIWRSSFGSSDVLHVRRLPGTRHSPTLAADPKDLDEKGPISSDYERVLVDWLRTVAMETEPTPLRP